LHVYSNFKDSCQLYGQFKNIFEECTSRLNGINQEKSNFGFGWSQFNQNYSPPFGYQAIYNAFQFKDSDTLQGLPIQGKFDTYDGNGYVYELRGKLSFIQGNLTLLQQMGWIDRHTRAVFVEFCTYNVNIGLIMVSTILVEFLESGSILVTSRFDTLNLFNDIGGIYSFKTISQIVFYAFVVYFTVKEITQCFTVSLKSYFKEFWSYIEWSIIITAYISLIMSVLRLISANEVLAFFKRTAGYGYIKLQKVDGYNQTLTYSLGLSASIGAIKILKLLRFNQNISILGVTLKRCFVELTSFSFQIMYLVFNANLEGYLSIFKSMGSAFEIMIGKLSAGQFVETNSILGPIIISGYNAVILFFALNIFISIIIDSFEKVRQEAKDDPDKFGFLDHLTGKFKKMFGIFSRKSNSSSSFTYKDHLTILPKYVDNVIDLLVKVNALNLYCSNLIRSIEKFHKILNNA